MRRCFQLAEQGFGNVSPNPMVGAVLVYDNQIIAEGWHQAYGAPHAEVNCLNSLREQDKDKVPHSSLYVSLEPCSHQGKTPPCSNLIIEHNIKQVIIANTDPNPLVAGSGIKQLQQAGIEVITGILETEGHFLNRRFFTYHKQNRPYIILKWAQSADGYFTKHNDQQHWITGDEAKKLVHQWRHEEDAILVGTNTARVDNPELTNRFFEHKGNPTRVLIDKNLTLPNELKLFNEAAPTLVINASKDDIKENIEWLKIEFDENWLKHLLNKLATKHIQSLIVEGGAKVLQQFIDTGVWDEARVFTGSVNFNGGLAAPELHSPHKSETTIGNDTLKLYYNTL